MVERTPTRDYVEEQAYLVSRGVRPLAIVGVAPPTQRAREEAISVLYKTWPFAANGCPIPFVIVRPDGLADYGYAARQWVVDELEWLHHNVPHPHLDRLLGLLLGYSADAIAAHDEWGSGHRFSFAQATS